MAIADFTLEELTTEEWRPVVGYEGRYEVSNLGRVKSLRFRGHNGGALMSRKPNSRGYPRVSIGSGRNKRYFTVHVMVALAFHGPRPTPRDGYRIEVNHEDGVKTNCRASNLEYVTQLVNAQHASTRGLYRSAAGDRHGTKTRPESVPHGERKPFAKLTDADIPIIRSLLAAGERQQAIANRFGVCRPIISMVKTRKIWAHVP